MKTSADDSAKKTVSIRRCQMDEFVFYIALNDANLYQVV